MVLSPWVPIHSSFIPIPLPLLILPSYVPNRVSPVLKTLQFLSSFCRVYLVHPLSHHSPPSEPCLWSSVHSSSPDAESWLPGFPSRAPLGMVTTFFLLKTLPSFLLSGLPGFSTNCAHLRFLGFLTCTIFHIGWFNAFYLFDISCTFPHRPHLGPHLTPALQHLLTGSFIFSFPFHPAVPHLQISLLKSLLGGTSVPSLLGIIKLIYSFPL